MFSQCSCRASSRYWPIYVNKGPTYIHIFAWVLKRGTGHAWISWLEFSALGFVYFFCEYETAINFCGTSWVWVSIFFFHNLLSTQLDRCPCVVTTTAWCLTHTQSNDYFILHFTPTFSHLSSSPFRFSFCLLQLHSPRLVTSLSHSWLHSDSIISLSLILNFLLFPEVSPQPQLPSFSVFHLPSAVPFLYNFRPQHYCDSAISLWKPWVTGVPTPLPELIAI